MDFYRSENFVQGFVISVSIMFHLLESLINFALRCSFIQKSAWNYLYHMQYFILFGIIWLFLKAIWNISHVMKICWNFKGFRFFSEMLWNIHQRRRCSPNPEQCMYNFDIFKILCQICLKKLEKVSQYYENLQLHWIFVKMFDSFSPINGFARQWSLRSETPDRRHSCK